MTDLTNEEQRAELMTKLAKDREFLLNACKLALRVHTEEQKDGVLKGAIDSVENR